MAKPDYDTTVEKAALALRTAAMAWVKSPVVGAHDRPTIKRHKAMLRAAICYAQAVQRATPRDPEGR